MQKSPSNTKSELAAVCKRLLLPLQIYVQMYRKTMEQLIDPSNARYTPLGLEIVLGIHSPDENGHLSSARGNARTMFLYKDLL